MVKRVVAYRLSPQQERLWGRAGEARLELRVVGPLQLERLRRALEEVVAAHDILRTTFRQQSGTTAVLQVIRPEVRIADNAELCNTDFTDQSNAGLGWVVTEVSAEEHEVELRLPALCADAWTLPLLVQELAQRYGGEWKDVEGVSYAQFGEWQRELAREETEEAERARQFWAQQRVADVSGETLSGELREQEVELVAPLSREELLAAWLVLMWRERGGTEENLVVHVGFDGRKYVELKGLLGPCAKYLPIRVRTDSNIPFSSLVKRLGKSLRSAHRWQEYFTDVGQDEIRAFPLGFEYAEQTANWRAGGVEFSISRQSFMGESFGLKLNCYSANGSLQARIRYDTGACSRDRARRLAARLAVLLQSVVRQPRQAIGELELLPEEERQQLLFAWNESAAPFAKEECIHELFEAQVRRTPQAVAVVCGEQQLSYGELNGRANQLARYLQGLENNAPDDLRVGLCVERSLEMVVGMLGVLKAGGAYVPLDPQYPTQRLSYMLADAAVSVLLTQASVWERLPEYRGPVVLLDQQWEEIERADETDLPGSGSSAENLAYVIYTSGSTGQPKGVMVPHRALVNYTTDMCERLPVKAGWSYATFSGPAADLGYTALYPALCGGGTLHVIEGDTVNDAEALGAYFARHAIDCLKVAPTQLAALQATAGARAVMPRKRLVLGGEAADSEWVARVQEQWPECEVLNHYGPTEATVGALTCEIEARSGKGLPIGRPIRNVRAYVLEARGGPAPVGVKGELYLGGAGLARGYANGPAQTAERFVPDAYSGAAGARLYRTGDLARWTEDAQVEFVGRADGQVKVRGHRVELGEVEAALLRHAAVREAAVAVRTEQTGDTRLVAFIVPKAKQSSVNQTQIHSLPENLEVFYLNKNEADHLYREIFEDELYLKHGITINDDDCILDVGANIGLFTLFAHKRGARLKMYAFEPNPAAFEKLSQNVKRYGLGVSLFNCGLADEDKEATYTYYPQASVMSGFYANLNEERELFRAFMLNQQKDKGVDQRALSELAEELTERRFESERFVCKLKTLSSIISENNIECINLLKIDVEKSELDVLLGIADADWEKIKQIVIEVHDLNNRVERVVAMLRDKGFDVTEDMLLEGTGVYNIFANKYRNGSSTRAKTTAARPLPVINNTELSAGSLQQFVRERLPEHMVPSAFVLLQQLPRLRSGKVDRSALPATDELDSVARCSEYVGPRTPVEELICGVWEQLLGVGRVGIDDNFFELGGHSLLATQVVSRIRESLRVELALRNLFDHPTIRGLAASIEGRETASEQPPLTRADRSAPLALSFSQQRLWFLHQLEPESVSYNIPKAVRLRGSLDLTALEQALTEIVRRHEVLRTTFSEVDGQPFQIIAPPAKVSLPLIDLGHLPLAQAESEAHQRAAEEARRPFDLVHGPLLRATVLRLAAEDHVVLLTIHHIVSDGWSTGIFMREVAPLYEAYAEGHESPLPEPAIQYADYAVWQREWLQGEVLEQQLDYWRKHLGEDVPALKLPADKLRPTKQSYNGARQSMTLSQDLSAKLKTLSRSEGATLFMSLLAALQILLARYSGQRDFAIGTPIAGRNRSEIEGLIGFFINTVVLRAEVAGNPSFRELLQRVRESALTAYAHQDIPFEKLVEELQPQRDLSRSPLFQVMLNMLNLPETPVKLGQLRLENFMSVNEAVKFDLTVYASDDGANIAFQFAYNSDLFNADRIVRMMDHFRVLLEEIVADPDRAVETLSFITDEEQTQLISTWNQTSGPLPVKALHELFAEQVARAPNNPAVVCGSRQWSYAELNSRANKVARYLHSRGILPGMKVGICLERDLEMIACVLGVLKAGGAFVILDPDYPSERLSFMREDAQVSVVLTQADQFAAVDDTDLISVGGERAPYVIYTSGSTGVPKGVLVSQKGVVNYLDFLRERHDLNASDTVLQVTSLSFDPAVRDIFGALTTGARLLLLNSEEARNPSLVLQRIREHGVTAILSIVRSLLRAMSEVEMQPNKLRLLMTCGEALNESDYKHARALFGPNVELVNQYGVSEYAMAATYCPLDDETVSQSHHGSLPIGRPVTNTQIYILDNHFNPQPIGVMGELYIGGVGLAQGYLNRPHLTAERFIPHPFSEHAGERLYRTGDAARYLSDGRIQYLGRLDDQVKVRGYRIELGEIEAVLRRHGQVTEAVVVMREDEAGEQRLVAYVVGKDLTVGQLREHLQRVLPEYMSPSAFVMLEKLPLTANGKVDRKSLPAPGPERPELESTFTAPHTETEQKLAEIWRHVLKVEQVGVGDNFFELGGHSLLATQVISRVRDVFQVELPLRNLFETPTIGELAATISEMHSGGMEARAANQIEVISQAELLKQLDEMGKEEVDLLFATMIAGTGNSEPANE